jgi:hypothetical protein
VLCVFVNVDVVCEGCCAYVCVWVWPVVCLVVSVLVGICGSQFLLDLFLDAREGEQALKTTNE